MIYVVNHQYHLKWACSKFQSDDLLIVISDRKFPINAIKGMIVVWLPLFEALSIRQKIFFRFQFLLKLITISALSNIHQKVIFFGGQDVVSFWLLKRFKGKEIKLIPDNVEFYLRYSPKATVRFTQKAILNFRSILYGVWKEYLKGGVVFQMNRFVFDFQNVEVGSPAFLERYEKLEMAGCQCVFISQPYYLDYGIDLDLWVSQLLPVLKSRGCNNVKFHPRDSKAYKQLMNSSGVKEIKFDEDMNMFVGIFSTYMFTLASRGHEVTSIFKEMEGLLPDEYVTFVKKIMNGFEIQYCSKNKWPNKLVYKEKIND
jgi:hypothetical protein